MPSDSPAASSARRTRRLRALIGGALLLATAGCGRGPRISLPMTTGEPFPDFLSAYHDATLECAAITRLSASIALSGRAGRTKLSARIDAGFAAPAQIRLEGYPRVSFGGGPFFVLVSSGTDATLVMPRDRRVLRGAAPSVVLEALAGVALGPADLRALAAGCGLPVPVPASGRTAGADWTRIEAGDTSIFLRRMSERWRVAGAIRAGLTVMYSDFAAGRPSTVHVTTAPDATRAGADLRLRLSQIEIDPVLDARVFEADVPRDAVPLTLEELRSSGPLGAGDAAPR